LFRIDAELHKLPNLLLRTSESVLLHMLKLVLLRMLTLEHHTLRTLIPQRQTFRTLPFQVQLRKLTLSRLEELHKSLSLVRKPLVRKPLVRTQIRRPFANHTAWFVVLLGIALYSLSW
jgi:hypothetical protein